MDKKMRILIAEDSLADEELFLRALRPFVKSRGLVVDSVCNGDEAMASIKKENYDLLFLDMNMPGPTGIEILRYVKKNHRKEKVVILTGYPDLNDDFCKKLGADEYFEKPVDPKALGAILDKYAPEKNPDSESSERHPKT